MILTKIINTLLEDSIHEGLEEERDNLIVERENVLTFGMLANLRADILLIIMAVTYAVLIFIKSSTGGMGSNNGSINKGNSEVKRYFGKEFRYEVQPNDYPIIVMLEQPLGDKILYSSKLYDKKANKYYQVDDSIDNIERIKTFISSGIKMAKSNNKKAHVFIVRKGDVSSAQVDKLITFAGSFDPASVQYSPNYNQLEKHK